MEGSEIQITVIEWPRRAVCTWYSRHYQSASSQGSISCT